MMSLLFPIPLLTLALFASRLLLGDGVMASHEA